MDIEINISFGANSVFVQSGSLNKQFANLMTLENNKIVEIGKTGEEFEKDNPQHWEKMKDTLIFEPIFDPQNFNPEHMQWATRLFASNIHHELRGINLFDKILCNVNIPKYELFQTSDKQHFETSLEQWDTLRSLSVNGITVISKGWQYRLAEFSLHWAWRILLVLSFFFLAKRADILFNMLVPLVAKLSFGAILVFPILGVAAIWLTEIVWMLVMQWLLPKKILHRMFSVYQLQFAPFNKISLSRLFVNAILGKDE